MKFELVLKNEKNEDRVVYYDNAENTLKGILGDTIEIKNQDKENNRRPAKIALQLGFSCNMSCSYCLQSKAPKRKFDETKAKQLVEKLKNTDLTFARVEFWGGEPLVYLEEIKYILEHNTNLPSDGYVIITNGSLLTKDLVEYLTNHGVMITISHDAQGQSIRGKDPLDNPKVLEAIKWLMDNDRTPCFNSVITKDNISTKERLEFFSKKLGIPKEQVIHSGEGPVTNTEKDFVGEEYQQAILKDLYEEGLLYGYNLDTLSNFYNNINNKKTRLDSISCNITSDNYKVISLDGKKLTCHNFLHNFEIQPTNTKEGCLKCPVVNMCKGGCTAIPKDSEEFKNNCRTSYNYFLPLFKFAIEEALEHKYFLTSIRPL